MSRSVADYYFGCICRVGVELAPVTAMLDVQHAPLPIFSSQDRYILGNYGARNVVIAKILNEDIAAAVATQLLNDFPNVRFILSVGIGAGIPGWTDVRLGDVVVGRDGLMQYDLVEVSEGERRFRRTGSVIRPPPIVSSAVRKLDGQYRRQRHQFTVPLDEMLTKHPHMKFQYGFPADTDDNLFHDEYPHQQPGGTCDDCDTRYTVTRSARPDSKPMIHYGVIVSANSATRDAATREELERDGSIICVETKAIGTMDDLPFLAIRGVCDYADSHKNQRWQPYAAAVATAYMKELLISIPLWENEEVDAQAETIKDDRDHPEGFQKRGKKTALEALVHNLPESFVAITKKALLNSLSFDGMDERRLNIAPAMNSTCQWLLESSEFRDWLDPGKSRAHNEIFWIKGKPGCGKSVLMGFLSARLEQDYPDMILLRFFLNATGKSLEKNLPGLYRSLLFQLLDTSIDFAQLQNAVTSNPRFSQDGLHTTTEKLEELLRQAIERLGDHRITILIDAVDECDEEAVRIMVHFFKQLGSAATADARIVRVVFSSRHYPHITIPEGGQLVVEDQPGHDRDIKAYVTEQLEKFGEFQENSKLGSIRDAICEKAGGCFLWVVLVVNKVLYSLAEDHPLHMLLTKTYRLPVDLIDFLMAMFGRMEGDPERMANIRQCVRWILFANRPLNPRELYLAVSSGRRSDRLGPWDSHYISTDVLRRIIMHWSGGLAQITGPEHCRVQFIHETIEQFWLRDNMLRNILDNPIPGIESSGLIHNHLKECCEVYIQGNSLIKEVYQESSTASPFDEHRMREQVLQRYPFLEYATQHVLMHADISQGMGVDQKDFLTNFRLSDWIHLNNIAERHEKRHHQPDTSLLYILAHDNRHHLIRRLLQDQTEVSAPCGRHGNPIFAAIVNDSHEAFEELISWDTSRSPLGCKFPYNEEGILSILSQCDVQDLAVRCLSFYKFDFSWASDAAQQTLQDVASRGHEKLVHALLLAGARVNAQGGFYGNALQGASRHGRWRVVQVLLDAEADVNAAGGYYGSAIQAASRSGREKVVQMLLSAGADVNIQGGHYGNALQVAAVYGDEIVVRTLLEAGSDVNAQGGFYDNALWGASVHGHEKVVQMLLAAGADNTAGKQAPDLDSVLSTLIGSSDSISSAEAAREYLSRLLREDSRLRSFYSAVAEFSTIGNQELANVLRVHFKRFAHDLVRELNAQKGTTNREACKLVLHHAGSLAEEIAQRSRTQEEPEFFAILHAQSEESGKAALTQRFLDEEGASGQAEVSEHEFTADKGIQTTITSEVQKNADQDAESNRASNSTISDQVDHQSLILEAFLRLFEQSESFLRLVDSLWLSIRPNLFDWRSIDLCWQEEFREPAPVELRYLIGEDVRCIEDAPIQFFDRIKLIFEDFTGKPWDWSPFRPPRRPYMTDKVRLEWDTCCGRTQCFDVSSLLSDKIQRFIKLPVDARKGGYIPSAAAGDTPQFKPLQANKSSNAVDPGQTSSPQGLPGPGPGPDIGTQNPLQSQRSQNLPQSSSEAPANQHQPQQRDRFLLLCVRNMSGPNSLRHGQIEVPVSMTDNDFFDEFRRKYRELRGWCYWFHPDKFWYCHCSRFYKWDNDKISWEENEMPLSADKRYYYNPKPPFQPYKLPVSSDEWEHRYHQDCNRLMRSDFLGRIPLRDSRFEINTCINAHYTWGLHVEYRTSARVVLAWSLICVSPGFLFFILWLIRFANDLQNASVPAMLILTFVAFPIGLVTLGRQFNQIRGV